MLSVIIPVYKVEAYIGRCLQSLFNARIEDVEYVFIDDGTPDRSMAVVDSWRERLENQGTVVVHHFEKN